MKKFLVPVTLLILVVALAGCIGGEAEETGEPTGGTTPTTPTGGALATLVLSVKDEALDTSEIEELTLEVDEITIQCPEIGWITLSNETHIINLLELQDEEQLLVEMNITECNYTQLRLHVRSALIKRLANAGWENITLPSGILRFNHMMRLRRAEATGVSLDFDLNKSLHITGNDRVILAPVVKMRVMERVRVVRRAAGRINYENDSTTSEEEIGMDEDGNMGRGLMIQRNATLNIENGRIRAITRLLNRTEGE